MNWLFFILKIFNIDEKRFFSDKSLKYSELFFKNELLMVGNRFDKSENPFVFSLKKQKIEIESLKQLKKNSHH